MLHTKSRNFLLRDRFLTWDPVTSCAGACMWSLKKKTHTTLWKWSYMVEQEEIKGHEESAIKMERMP